MAEGSFANDNKVVVEEGIQKEQIKRCNRSVFLCSPSPKAEN